MSAERAPQERAVVVTGASSGIGRAIALYLSDRGWSVFAGVRRGEDATSLRAADSSIVPLLIDVTDAESVRRAVADVRAQLDGVPLCGLVNNAGVAGGGPVEFLSLDELRAMLEVNVVGVVAVTQAFLPLLRESRGRVAVMGSISGRLAYPYLSPYAMSKKAVSALCDSLRVELRPWSIAVSLIEPGTIDTPIWDKSRRRLGEQFAAWPAEADELYGGMVSAMRVIIDETVPHAIPAVRVAEVVERALTSRRPRTRYLVGLDARLISVISRMPDRARDTLLGRVLDRAAAKAPPAC